MWGLDPSPYLLRHAAHDHPGIEFIPGLAEDLPFANQSLDGIALCFVLHEIPPKYIEQALAEFARVLKPGGKLVIAEPSHEQLQPLQLRELVRGVGWSKLYFKVLAGRVYEPFVDAWHKLDKPNLLAAAGFTPSIPTQVCQSLFGLQKNLAKHHPFTENHHFKRQPKWWPQKPKVASICPPASPSIRVPAMTGT